MDLVRVIRLGPVAKLSSLVNLDVADVKLFRLLEIKRAVFPLEYQNADAIIHVGNEDVICEIIVGVFAFLVGEQCRIVGIIIVVIGAFIFDRSFTRFVSLIELRW